MSIFLPAIDFSALFAALLAGFKPRYDIVTADALLTTSVAVKSNDAELPRSSAIDRNSGIIEV